MYKSLLLLQVFLKSQASSNFTIVRVLAATMKKATACARRKKVTRATSLRCIVPETEIRDAKAHDGVKTGLKTQRRASLAHHVSLFTIRQDSVSLKRDIPSPLLYERKPAI